MSSAVSNGCLPFHEVDIPDKKSNWVNLHTHIDLFLMGAHSKGRQQWQQGVPNGNNCSQQNEFQKNFINDFQ